jgi:hypothetical protein
MRGFHATTAGGCASPAIVRWLRVKRIKEVFKQGAAQRRTSRKRHAAHESTQRPLQMPALAVFFAGLALGMAPQPGATPAQSPPVAAPAVPEDPMAIWQRLADGFLRQERGQVRIEQHIIWRVAPMPGPAREAATTLAPTARPGPRMTERKMGECLPMSAIAGGQSQGGSRLLLFLRDRRLVAADLERSCSARDFYSGFYVDKPNPDGRLCADRDRILARNGARCEIARFRLLVADD